MCSTTVTICCSSTSALFDHLVGRWRDLFNVSFDVLLYDLTSTYFEIDPPLDDEGKRQFGYSRDHRSDCVQVVIALIITPEGFPLAYEVLAGNTADNTTLRDFLARIEHQYGKGAAGSGCATVEFPPRRYCGRCASATRRCSTWWALRRAG